jgi:hypothetical protein
MVKDQGPLEHIIVAQLLHLRALMSPAERDWLDTREEKED